MYYGKPGPWGSTKFLGKMAKEKEKEKKITDGIVFTREEHAQLCGEKANLRSPHTISGVTKIFYKNSEDELWMGVIEEFSEYSDEKKMIYAKSLRDELDLFHKKSSLISVIELLDKVFDNILIKAGQALAKKNIHQIRGQYGLFILNFINKKGASSKKKISSAYIRKIREEDKAFFKKAINRTLNDLTKKNVIVKDVGQREVFSISEFTYREDSKWLYVQEKF